MFKELLSLLTPSSALPADERRETIRLRCRVEVEMKAGRRVLAATVLNVSLTGLCIEFEGRLKPKQEITLVRDDFGQPLKARAVWCRAQKGHGKHRAGVQYIADQQMLRASWLKPSLKQVGFSAELISEKRKLLRVPGRVQCRLLGMTGGAYTDGEMLNLSLGGALVEGDVELPKDLAIEFETNPLGGLPPLRGVARVVSCRHNSELQKWRCGLKFTESNHDDIRKYMKSMMASR